MASNEPEFDEELKRRRTGELFQVESELVQAAGTSMEEEIKMAEQGDGAGEEGESSADMAINSSPIKRRSGRPQGSKKLKVQSELVQAAGTSMEEEIKMAETEQGDGAGEEGESSADMAINSSPIKRRSGMPQGSKKLKVQSELVQAAGTTMEEEIKMAEQGDGAGEEGESSADVAINSSPIKRRSGMPQGSKKLKVCVTDIKLMELVSGISNGGSTQPQKGRGSPKLSITTHTEEEEEGSGDNQAPDSVPAHRAKGSPKGTPPQRGRGRPKLSITTHTEEEEEEEGSGDDQAPDSVPAHRAKGSPKGTQPQRGRGRPKLSITTHTEEEEEEGSGDDQAPDSVPAHRAKGSPKGTPPQRGRGRPKLSITTHTEEEEEEEGSGDDQAPDSVPAHRAKGSPKGTPPQRGRGRPKLSITTYTEEEEGSGDDQAPDSVPAHRAKGSPKGTPPQRGRGRPKLSITTHTEEEEEEEGSGDDQAPDSVPAHRAKGSPKGSKKKTSKGDDTPKKRGRPKKYLSNNTTAAEQLPNGGSEPPKMKRGRPKGSVKRVPSPEVSSVKRKRGRPKGSPNKKPRLQTEVSSEEDEEDEEEAEEEEEVDTDGSVSSPTERVGGQLRSTRSNGISDTPQRRRGRPRKSQATDGSQEVTRGRPKGSLKKKSPAFKVQETTSRSKRVHFRSLRLTSSPPPKRGRPRKNPLPTTEERNKPRVWKQLGRPRKYPRPDPPEGDPTGPRRGPGRPRKTESKKGAHLRKRLPFTSSPSNSDDGSPRKSRQALSPAKNEAVVPRKRGRPKSSANANKASVETELDRASPAGDSTAVEEEPEAEPAEEEEEEQEHDVQTTSTEHVGDTEEMLIEQNANFEVSDQA